ncbi:DNA-directed RNA polymerase sigma-70 factor [Pilimelia anulata]|uniref:DNA-directed RNA polymerase sigma-70 factor n=1 Tax=Pilimelia anulata TaxID=53371 RepID=A0A8J3B4Y7_9ACTN|nr:sigma-70 family RNA polymerase sigma factor [Pilimelia anulata]GGJ81882.1 DNA-directed RNA polymerase sigma-70 factor [Pilimelia anulata]
MVRLKARSSQRARDEALVRALHEEHGAAILAYAGRLTGDRAAAEDILQETLIRAWRHAGDLSAAAGSIRGWMFTVARNLVADRGRARGARPTEVAQAPTTVPVERDHAQSVVDSLVALDALERLSAEHRSVLVSIYFHGRSVAETAEALGIPAGTVKSRCHHALRQLRHSSLGRAIVLEGVA